MNGVDDMSDMNGMPIQWFPGHMAKARRLIEEQIKLVDAVCEIADARIPMASRNPELPALLRNKPRLLALNRADLADPAGNKMWTSHFRDAGQMALLTDGKSGAGTARVAPAIKTLLANQNKTVGRVLRVMVVGIPNVGKSSLINRLAGRRAAPAEDRPGVTRGRQWVRLRGGLELLDTPGVLWPKFSDERTGLLLACTGAIRDDILDMETLAAQLIVLILAAYPGALAARYRLDPSGEADGSRLLVQAARKRGFLLSGGRPDTERMARILLDEFRGGKLGRMTLQWT